MIDNIIDIIKYKSEYSTHYYVVVKQNESVYTEIKPNIFQSEVGGIYRTLNKAGGTDAFAGREFVINLTDGTTRTCKGNYWEVCPVCDEELITVGVATIKDLQRCYVFTSGCIKKSVIENWLSKNKPKTDYDFYRNFLTDEKVFNFLDSLNEIESNVYNPNLNISVSCLKKIIDESDRRKKDTQLKEKTILDYMEIIEALRQRLLDGIDDIDERNKIMEDICKENKIKDGYILFEHQPEEY